MYAEDVKEVSSFSVLSKYCFHKDLRDVKFFIESVGIVPQSKICNCKVRFS